MSKTSKSKAPKTALSQSPSHLMHRALQLSLDIYSEEVADLGLTQRQFAVLEAVSMKAGLTQTELVKTTGIDRSTLADLVARMTRKGLLLRETSSLDARAKAVRLSEEGQQILDSVRPRVQAADKRIIALLPKSKREAFIDILTQLAATADAVPELIKSEIKAAKKAAKDAKKADKLARKLSKRTTSEAVLSSAA